MTPRERLLEATILCLHERGWARTTTREIVARAGMHVPSVNYHFGSKERLLHDAAVEALRRWGATTMEAVDPTPSDPATELRRSVARFLDTLDDDRAYVVAAVEAFAQAERSDELRRRLGEAYATFRALVADRIEVGAATGTAGTGAAGPSGEHPAPAAVDGDRPALAQASLLIALFDGLAIQRLLAPGDGPTADQVVDGLGLLGAILAPGRA